MGLQLQEAMENYVFHVVSGSAVCVKLICRCGRRGVFSRISENTPFFIRIYTKITLRINILFPHFIVSNRH